VTQPVEISNCTVQDYDQILAALPEFWDGRDTRHLHHVFLIHEFGDTAFVIRDGRNVVAYLFGFSRRPSRSDTCMQSRCEHRPADAILHSTCTAASSNAPAVTAAATSRR